jgi:glycogen(starch) synthase
VRVLYWTEQFWPYIGGVEVLGVEFVRALTDRGHEVTVLTSHGSLDLPDVDEHEDVPIHRFPFLRALAERDIDALARALEGVAAVKRKVLPDVVHLRFTDPSVLFHLKTEDGSRVPLLVSIEVMLPEAEAGPGSLVGRVLRRADHVTAVSHATLDGARRLVPEIHARSSVVYNALPRSGRPPTPPPMDRPLITCIGRVVEDKGFDLAIRAMPRIVEFRPDARLTIAGDGPARGALESLAADLGVADAVFFAGWIPPERIPVLIEESTLVVVPSRWEEAFGLVALEAARGMRPVVATRVGGLPEVVADGETGIVVPPEDPDAIANAVLTLLGDPATAETMGGAAAERARRNFGFERYVDEYETLYDQLQDGRPAHAGAELPPSHG